METIDYATTFLKEENEKELITVYSTYAYGIFKFLTGNRDINKSHVNSLKESMKKEYLFTIITINGNGEVIDGQHRLQACKELNLPVRYIIIKNYGLKEVQMLNAITSNWTNTQYLESYCKLGFQEYIDFKRFKKKYNFPHRENLLLLVGGHVRDLEIEFKKGTLKIRNYKEACFYADDITKISKYYVGYKRRHFITAMYTLLKKDNFSIDEFIQKLEYQRTALVDCINRNSYLALIEEIYNYHRRIKINLRY